MSTEHATESNNEANKRGLIARVWYDLYKDEKSHVEIEVWIDGLGNNEPDFDCKRAKRTSRRAHDIRVRRRHAQQLTNSLFVVAMVLLLLVAVPVVFESWPLAGIPAGWAVIVLIGALACRQRYWELGDELVDAENEFDRLTIPLLDDQRRTLKLFQNHGLELRRYYSQALRHGSFIFWLGALSIAGGFAVVAGALVTISQAGQDDSTEKIVLATLGIVSGIMANFIGAVYIRMYSQTVSSLSEFHTRLVGTHHLHVASLIASRIGTQDRQEEVLADMSRAIATGNPPPVMPSGFLITPFQPTGDASKPSTNGAQSGAGANSP